LIMTIIGHDVFGWTNALYHAEDVPEKGPSFKSFLESDAIKENLGSGGRWSDANQALHLMDEEHLYIVLMPGWNATIKVKDLESGVESKRVASDSAPVLSVEGVNGVVRLLEMKDPEGNSYQYS